jgi:ATP-binding cassette subfamily B protein
MGSLRKLVPFLRPYRALALLALASLAALVVLDLAIPRLVQRIIDQGIHGGQRAVVWQTALVMLAISLVSAVIAIGNNRFSVLVGEGVARDLRAALFAQIQTWSFGNLGRVKTGPLLVRLTSDVAALKMLTQISLRIGTRAPLMMLGSLALMVATSAHLALVLLPLLAVTGGLIAFFVLRMEPLFARVQQALDGLNGVLQENVAGVRLVKALVRAEHEEERFGAASNDVTLRSIASMEFISSMTPALTLCINLGVALVVWSGGAQAIRGELSLGQVVAFTNYLFTTMMPLVTMTMLSSAWAAGLAYARRVQEIFDTAPDVVDAPDAAALPPGGPARVALEQVSFAYRGAGNEPVLRDLELVAEAGQTVAILGATGAGKTTLVNLLPRFYDVTSGSVRVDGRDVRALTQASLLAHLSEVPQKSLLFSGTVRDNLRYGRPGATDQDVEAAARVAQAHDFILRLPGGYDARVEQRGANLSGGQRQRLAIARAVLLQPGVLILDDSTSSVDVETETRIQRGLAALGQAHPRITFVVAQRISTVLGADKIVVLDKGRIVAQGTHRELLASSAVYREIYDSQLGAGLDPAALDGAAP